MPPNAAGRDFRPWMNLLLPISRAELPGWGRVLRAAGVMVPYWDESWSGAAARTCRGKLHGYEMTLDLSDWSERLTFFLGRYYELAVQETLLGILRPGDRFVDVGANIGMISLVGAAAVGREGSVESVEPNPVPRAALEAALAANDIEHVTVLALGLGDAPSRLTLSITSDHSGTGTLTEVDADEVSQAFEIDVVRGDDVLLPDPRPVRMIKIDVEGFEHPALVGLRGVLERDGPYLITEFTPETMDEPQAEFAALTELLAPLGYRAWGLTTQRVGLRHRTHVVSLAQDTPPAGHPELLWCSEAALAETGLPRL